MLTTALSGQVRSKVSYAVNFPLIRMNNVKECLVCMQNAFRIKKKKRERKNGKLGALIRVWLAQEDVPSCS